MIFRVKDPFRDSLEKSGCEHTSPSRGRLHCLKFSVQVFSSSYQQPGTPVAEKSTVTALVSVMSILLLHSTKGHQDHKDHNELAALDVN